MAKATHPNRSVQSGKKSSKAILPAASSRSTGETAGAISLQAALSDPQGASPQTIAQLQRQYGNRSVQRLIQRANASQQPEAPIGLKGGAVGGDLQGQIDSARGGGRPLDHGVGTQIGGALGADFSSVHVHTGPAADGLNRSLSARAFTTGSDIFFSQGSYNPGTHSGKQLLAHELTHVVQQGGGKANRVQTKLTVGPAGDKYEEEADHVASQVMRQIDRPVAEKGVFESGATTIARQIAIGNTVPAGKIQRAVGFEFQTGWGLIRNVADDHVNHNRGRADDPDPESQADYEDTDMDHPNFPVPVPVVPPVLSKWQRLRRWGKKQWRNLRGQPGPVAQPPAPITDAQGNEKVSDTQWKTPGQESHTVTRPGANRKHLKFFKGQVLKKYGTNVKLTVDDASTPLGAELEWVVDPPIQESEGVPKLTLVMTELENAVQTLLPFKDRDSFQLSEASGDQADSHIELQPGVKGNSAREMKAAAQMTGGISFDKLYTMFKEVGKGEAKGVDKDDPDKTDLESGASNLKGASGAVGENAAAAADKIEGSPELKGLVAFIARYLSMGRILGQNVTYKNALNYAKASSVFLARTDFAKMFSMLPDLEHYHYTEDPADFVRLIETATGLDMDKMVLERGVKQDPTNKNGGLNDVHFRVSVTRRKWLLGIVAGEDRLSAKNAKAQTKGYAGDLESMGNLGKKTDKVGGDAGNDKNKWTGVVMEFRGNTTSQPHDEWAPYAINAFKYVIQLNAR